MEPTQDAGWKEPLITINGVAISPGAAMTVRVAIESYAMWLDENALGDDEPARSIRAGYLKQIQYLRHLLGAGGVLQDGRR